MDVGTWGTFRGTEGAAALPKTRHYKNISIDKKKWGADSQQRERELMLNGAQEYDRYGVSTRWKNVL